MPRFPCDECSQTFPNTFQLRQHKLGGECSAHKAFMEKRDEASATAPYQPYQFKLGTAQPAPIDDSWKRHGIAGAHHAAGGLGSTGVFFLDLCDRAGVCVLKPGSNNSAGEVFCARVLRHYGCNCPDIRVMTLDEFQELTKALAEVPFTSEGAGKHLQEPRAQKAGGMLMEFVNGFTFKDPRLADTLRGPDSRDLMRQLGDIVAVDMLLNNFDRTSMVWSHNGNANNILVSSQQGKATLVAIDNNSIGIQNKEGLDNYLEKVKGAIKEAREEKVHGPYVTKIRDYIMQYSLFEIDDAARRALQEGLLRTAKKIADQSDLSSIWESVFQDFSQAGWGAPGVDTINLPFYQAVAESMADALA